MDSSLSSPPSNIPLPPSIAEAMVSVRWPLDASSSPPMKFQSLEKMAEIRRQEAAAASAAASSDDDDEYYCYDVLGMVATLRQGIINNTTTTTCSHYSNDDDDDDDDEQEYLARIATACILLGHGWTDEAHNLVSSLSWPKELPFAYGPPVNISVNRPELLALASYVHCLVHRREGPHSSEFGMTGFGNADYWAGAALRSVGEESLPLADISNAVRQVASDVDVDVDDNNSEQAAQQWMEEQMKGQDVVGDWDPRFLTQLCAQVLEEQCNNGKQHALQEFAERAAEAELRVVLRHTLKSMGYRVAAA